MKVPADGHRAELGKIKSLISRLGELPGFAAIGATSPEEAFFSPEHGDCDLFVFSEPRLGMEARRSAWEASGAPGEADFAVLESPEWGSADRILLGGREFWFMHYSTEALREELQRLLAGDFPDRSDGYFYPIGRCATLAGLWPLADPRGLLAGWRAELARMPPDLADRLTARHLEAAQDFEDLERAAERSDLLFFHFALDIWFDAVLQALFALNRAWFPSRKRSLERIAGFSRKPRDAEARLLAILEAGAAAESLHQALEACRAFTRDLLPRQHTSEHHS